MRHPNQRLTHHSKRAPCCSHNPSRWLSRGDKSQMWREKNSGNTGYQRPACNEWADIRGDLVVMGGQVNAAELAMSLTGLVDRVDCREISGAENVTLVAIMYEFTVFELQSGRRGRERLRLVTRRSRSRPRNPGCFVAKGGHWSHCRPAKKCVNGLCNQGTCRLPAAIRVPILSECVHRPLLPELIRPEVTNAIEARLTIASPVSTCKSQTYWDTVWFRYSFNLICILLRLYSSFEGASLPMLSISIPTHIQAPTCNFS